MSIEKDDRFDVLLAANAGLIPALAPPDAAHKRLIANIGKRIHVPACR